MKMYKKFLIVLILSFVTACENDESNTGATDEKRVQTVLHVIDSENGKPITEVRNGQPVRFILELINKTDSTVEFIFPSGKQYDFEVRNQSKQLVWNWAHEQMFIQSRTAITLDAKEKIKFTPRWDQKDNDGKQVAPGKYTVTGMITAPGPEAQEKTFIIRELSNTDIDLVRLLAAPSEMVIGKNNLILKTDLWRDFMPISPPDGKALIAKITIVDKNNMTIPAEMTAEQLWVINGKEVWTTVFSDESRPNERQGEVEKVARNGPKWAPGITVDVVVGLRFDGKLWLLKAPEQPIQRTD